MSLRAIRRLRIIFMIFVGAIMVMLAAVVIPYAVRAQTTGGWLILATWVLGMLSASCTTGVLWSVERGQTRN